jgi:hypothetical protein
MTQAELARAAGTKQQTISYICAIEHETTASRYTIKIADILGVNPNWLATGQGDPRDPAVALRFEGAPHNLHSVAVYRDHDKIVSYALGQTPEPQGYLLTDRGTPGECWAKESSSLSLSGASVHVGDHLIFDRSTVPRPSDTLLAMVNKELLTLGTYRVRGDGYEIVPINPDYDTVRSGKNVQLIGVLIERRLYGAIPK